MKVKPYTWSSVTDFHILMHKTVSDLGHEIEMFLSLLFNLRKKTPTKFLLGVICLSFACSQHDMVMLK